MAAPDQATLDFIRDQLGSIVPFAAHVGVEIREVGDGTASAHLPEADHLRNHVGTQHAGALFTAAEAASGAAMAGALAPFVLEARSVVATARADYLRPANGPIAASAVTSSSGTDLRARYEQDGRVSFGVDVELTDGDGVVVARCSFDWTVRAPR